jgi:hypothetical protein
MAYGSDNSRSFDETYFQYNSHGDSSSGTPPTDRPNTLKGYAYYDFKWLKKVTTDIGLFQTILKVRRSAATSTSVSVSMHFRYIQRTAGCVKT